MSANSPSEFNLGPPAVDHSSYHSLTGPGQHLGSMHDRTLFGNKEKSKIPGGYKKRKSRKHKGGVETRFQKAMANFSRKKATEGMSILQINREWTKVARNGTWRQYIQPPPSNPQEGGRRKTRRRKTRRRKTRRRKARRRKTRKKRRRKTKRKKRQRKKRSRYHQIGCNK